MLSSIDAEIADDAILVFQRDLNNIGDSIFSLQGLRDPVAIEANTRTLIDDIHRITGNGEPYSEIKAADFKARRDAGESTQVSWESLGDYYNSLYVFFAGLLEDEETDEEDKDWDGSDDFNPDTRVDTIHQITWIQRWNEESSDSEKEARGLSIKRVVLSGILGKVGSEGRSE